MFSSREARVAERAERRAEEDREDWMRGRGRGGEVGESFFFLHLWHYWRYRHHHHQQRRKIANSFFYLEQQQPLPGNRRGQITRHPDRIGSYSVQTDNYAYHAQMDGNGRLRRLSEVGDDGRGHRLSLRRLGGGSGGDGGAAFLDTDDDEPTAPRGYSGGGLGARREEYDDDFEGPSTPRANSGRRMSFGRG